MSRTLQLWFRSLIFSLLLAHAANSPAQQSSGFKINDWPKNLRTDLKGTSIKVALPENAVDTSWNNALITKFQQLTGISVQVVRPGNDTTVVLAGYLRDIASGSGGADVYAIDIVWPGILADYAEDLQPQFGSLPDVLATLVQNDTVKGRLVAIPYFTEVSLLYYRTDLLQKYHFANPPQTWDELERQARTIQDGERAGGNAALWGYLWQGAASEALTCNAIEWQISHGAGSLISGDREPSIDRVRFAAALDRARGWVGHISPPTVTGQLEDDSLQMWKSGNAAFMRNWPYAYAESMKDDAVTKNRVGVTVLPAGDGANGRHADTLGGFQLMISKSSKNKAAAIELIKFLTSSEIQRVNATTRGYLPTRPVLYEDAAVLKANPFFAQLKDVLLKGAITRPSTAAGAAYDDVSKAYFTAVRETLTGQQKPDAALRELEVQLQSILGAKDR